MNRDRNEGNMCKSICWAIGLVFGVYLAYVLVNDFGQEIIQSSVLGIVGLLVMGLVLRRVFCRDNANTLELRMREATERAAGTDNRAEQLAARKTGRDAVSVAAETHADDSAAIVSAEMQKTEPQAEVETLTQAPAAVTPDQATTPAEDDVPVAFTSTRTKSDAADRSDEANSELTSSGGEGEKKELEPMVPRRQDAPNEGGPDDLRQIKGIGPETQKALNDIGLFHFAQFAKMTRREILWLDQNMPGIEGGASRDKWKKQCRKLAAGEDTKFSTRVKAGEVYD